MASEKEPQKNRRAQAAHEVAGECLPNPVPGTNPTALPAVDEDQEVAFWDNVLKAKAVQTNSQGTDAAAAAPISPRRLSHRQKKDRKVTITANRRSAAALERSGDHLCMHLGTGPSRKMQTLLSDASACCKT